METYLDDIRRIESGATFPQVMKLIKKAGVSQSRFAKLAGLSISTLAERKKKGRFNPVESERVLRLEKVFQLAVAVFDKNSRAARDWLTAPNSEFGNIAPFEMLKTDIGTEAVVMMLHRIDQGMF